MKKLFIIFTLLLISTILFACGSNKTASLEKVEAKNKHGIEQDIVKKIETNLKSQYKAIDEGDYNKYQELVYGEINSVYESVIKDVIIPKKPSTSLDKIDVLYQKDDEVLAYYEAKMISETYTPDSNMNQKIKGYAVFKKVDGAWKAVANYDEIATVVYLDGEGKENADYSHLNFDNSLTWRNALKRLKSENLTPTAWIDKVKGEIEGNKIVKSSLTEQPIEFDQAFLDDVPEENIDNIKKVLNALGDVPKDSITVYSINVYPDQKANGIFQTDVFIRNGFNVPIKDISGTVTISIKQTNGMGEEMVLEVASGEFDLSSIGTIQAGSTKFMTLIFDPDSVLVDNLAELNIDELKVDSILNHN
ncbi:SLAP domain-containing protein [Neobacillus sp. NPDC093182]|uniref:SLAP domain-containing protein n=1 Tax=Neobacillus sp. NPDC093182 TaxID=3364297 RepID=UPI0037FCB39D